MLENIYNMDILLLHKAHNVFSYTVMRKSDVLKSDA